MDIRDKARQIQIEIYKKMSSEDKWRRMQELWKTAWQVKQAGIKMLHPDWTQEQVEEKVRDIFIHART